MTEASLYYIPHITHFHGHIIVKQYILTFYVNWICFSSVTALIIFRNSLSSRRHWYPVKTYSILLVWIIKAIKLYVSFYITLVLDNLCLDNYEHNNTSIYNVNFSKWRISFQFWSLGSGTIAINKYLLFYKYSLGAFFKCI